MMFSHIPFKSPKFFKMENVESLTNIKFFTTLLLTYCHFLSLFIWLCQGRNFIFHILLQVFFNKNSQNKYNARLLKKNTKIENNMTLSISKRTVLDRPSRISTKLFLNFFWTISKNFLVLDLFFQNLFITRKIR
jgi:hypothetical protein